MTEAILTVQALERAGVKTIPMTEEEDTEDGTAPPLLVPAPEIVAVVSSHLHDYYGAGRQSCLDF